MSRQRKPAAPYRDAFEDPSSTEPGNDHERESPMSDREQAAYARGYRAGRVQGLFEGRREGAEWVKHAVSALQDAGLLAIADIVQHLASSK